MLPIKVPPLGESIVEATVSRWQKKEGDAVDAGDTLDELETDKITVEVPALKPGVLAKRAKNEGDIVHVDDILGELDETAVPAAAGATQGATAAGKAPTPSPISTPTTARSAIPAAASPPTAQSSTTKSSPAARRIADERGCWQARTKFPNINAQVDGESIVYKHYVNMGIAVASEQGLVVPNIKDADRKGTIELSREIGEVAKRASDGKLAMDDLTGGTFTITNGGVFGSLISTPIINYPQVGILVRHKTQDRPVAVGGQVVIRPMMYIALSYDHRIIDGQQAVLFLVRVKELMEDPASMLVD